MTTASSSYKNVNKSKRLSIDEAKDVEANAYYMVTNAIREADENCINFN